MSLESGTYHIISANGNYPIGRRLAEDRSLLPKGIYKLPMGTESVWEVEKLANGNYRLRNKGAIVGPAAGLLFAFLVEPEEDAKAEWNFRPDVARGEDAFIIFQESSAFGWILPESSDIDPYPHVNVGILIVGPSEPPHFPVSESFIFKKRLKDSLAFMDASGAHCSSAFKFPVEVE